MVGGSGSCVRGLYTLYVLEVLYAASSQQEVEVVQPNDWLWHWIGYGTGLIMALDWLWHWIGYGTGFKAAKWHWY